jgi:hypothetical protein
MSTQQLQRIQTREKQYKTMMRLGNAHSGCMKCSISTLLRERTNKHDFKKKRNIDEKVSANDYKAGRTQYV